MKKRKNESAVAGGGRALPVPDEAGEDDSFDPGPVRDFELEMKKRVHPYVLDFIHSGKRRMLYFAGLGFKVYAEDLVTPYQGNKLFFTASERAASGRGWAGAERLNYDDDFFDGVFCEHLFNYFAPDDGLYLLQRIRRMMKVGAVIAATFAAEKNIPGLNNRTIVLTADRFVKKKTLGDRLVKIYENREIENLLADFRLLKVVILKNGDRRVLAAKTSRSEAGPQATRHSMQPGLGGLTGKRAAPGRRAGSGKSGMRKG